MTPTDFHFNAKRVTRRYFLNAAVGTSAAFALRAVKALSAPAGNPNAWSIGCFNRPWSAFPYNDALDGIHSAGFTQIGLLGDHVGEPFTDPVATSRYLAELRKRIK